MARDPNGPIPGFEDEFTGTVGNEKRVHKTHFHMPEIRLQSKVSKDYEWVQVGLGKWRLIKREPV